MNKKNLILISAIVVAIIAIVIIVVIFGKEDKTESKVNVISSQEVSIGAPEYYGKIVENYSVPGMDKWRIYYADESNIYLIADDYISKDYVPDASNRSITVGANDYCFSFFGVYEDYVGAADIKEPVRKWLSAYLKENEDSTNTNIRVTAYLLDTTIWKNLADDTYAEYAIGAPTIEMFCASYKDTNKDRYLEFKADDGDKKFGYKVKWNDSEEYTYSLSWEKDYIKDNFNGIYVKSDYSKAHGMLLASTSMSSTYLIEISSTGGLGTRSFNLRDNVGLRPVVCIKSGIGIVKQDNGNYILK